MKEILAPILIFLFLGIIMGALLAVAAKLFHVKKDERAERILSCLPGANCGGCGYAGCSALADAIVEGKAAVSACAVGGEDVGIKVAEIMGAALENSVRMRAQVMCGGIDGCASKKYAYSGTNDCAAAEKLGGGDKTCAYGCIGLGSCAAHCPFGAISVRSGIASVDPEKCRGCGICVNYCPKGIIKLIPFDSSYYARCSSKDGGKAVRSYCEKGCVSCRICEKACRNGAIKVISGAAEIDYSLCSGCGKCADKCPRDVIQSIREMKF